MLAVILKILSVIGIILLCLLGVMLTAVLLVLFFPIAYRIKASKTSDSYDVSASVRWLFGLVRVKCRLPEPGNITAKVLFFKVFEMYPIKNNSESVKKTTESRNTSLEQTNVEKKEKTDKKEETDKEKSYKKATDKTVESGNNITDNAQETIKSDNNQSDDSKSGDTQTSEPHDETLFSKLSSKYEKTVYTIRNFYDKIKNISDEANFYKELLEDDNTKELIRHLFNRIGRILKSIRPKKLKADITFGAKTPDVTGYVYGIYAIFSSALGKNFYLNPDFTETILEGNLYAAGNIAVFTIMINALSVLLDKKLKILKRKLKKHSAKKKRAEMKAAKEAA
jgi:hypothetical protein